MAAATDFQIEVMTKRALVELAEGKTDGPGLQTVKVWIEMVDAGKITDPSLPRQPAVKPRKAIQTRPLTNETLDGRVRQEHTGPARGTREWFDALKARVKG
jgi:hypothetical protein